MKKCSEQCIPCCDFCVHVEHELYEIDGKVYKLWPIKCKLYDDEYHNREAEGCGYCEDFHCKAAIETAF